MSTTAKARAVLDFWFGPAPHATRGEWFRKAPAFDAAIRERFAATIAEALAGGLGDWCADAHGALARVIVLDPSQASPGAPGSGSFGVAAPPPPGSGAGPHGSGGKQRTFSAGPPPMSHGFTSHGVVTSPCGSMHSYVCIGLAHGAR